MASLVANHRAASMKTCFAKRPGSHPKPRVRTGALNRIGLSGLAALAFLTADCSRETPSPKPEHATAINAEAPVDAQAKARIAQAIALRQGIEPPKPALQLRGGELATPEVLAAYNQELLRARFKRGESPESLQELVQKWRELPRLPKPPPGKQIVYDVHNSIIRLEPP